MRRAFHAKLIYHESRFAGINLGYDFCAEHERGIKEIENAFGLNPDFIGIQRYQNSIVPKVLETIEFTDRKTQWVGMYFNAEQSEPMDKKELKKHMPMPFNQNEDSIFTAWDEKSFAIVVHKNNKWIIKELMNAISNKNLSIGISINPNPYSNGGLQLMIVSYIPQEIKDKILQSNKDYEKLIKAVKKTKIETIINKSGKVYYALTPQWYSSAFKPNGRELKTKYDVVFFLNPRGHSLYNPGWYTVEELQDWTKDKGIVLKTDILSRLKT